MNLIPEKAGKTPNYWCTWHTQNFSGITEPLESMSPALFEGEQGAKSARSRLNQEALFGECGWADFFPEIRRDLYLMLDDGWDVPYGVHPDENLGKFGSLELSEDRFPSFSGTPAGRLQKLNSRVQEKGWKGIGLWIAAQEADESIPQKEYWKQRMEWCRDAGISYWKVDWGRHAHDLSFRRMLTELASETYPDLLIEHAYNCGPVNGFRVSEKGSIETGRFEQWEDYAEKSLALREFSQVFRSYDVTAQLGTASTVDRLSVLLGHNLQGLVNCEDEPYLAAGLGCANGIMRSPKLLEIPGLDYDPHHIRHKLLESIRAVRWQRIAPAFAGTPLHVSGTILTDSWHFRPGETWMSACIGRTIRQSAPAALSRNMPLPLVSGQKDLPFVVCSKTPDHVVSAAILPRTFDHEEGVCPDTSVELCFDCLPRMVGLFGNCFSWRLRFPKRSSSLQVWAQDIARQTPQNISAGVRWEENTCVIPGSLIRQLCLTDDKEDLSSPGAAVYFSEP